MDYATVAAKASNSAFQARLRVALTEHCRYQLERARGGSESEERFAWERSSAREVLAKLARPHDAELAHWGRLVLLPAAWSSADQWDTDGPLAARVAERWSMLVGSEPPA
jgi:hypothetical protein